MSDPSIDSRRARAIASATLAAVLALGAFAAALAPLPADAHTDEMLAGRKTPNGGQMKVAGPFHVEFLVKGSEVRLFLYDHADAPADASRASASVQLVAGKERLSVELKPSGRMVNELAGSAASALTGEVRAVVRLQPAQGQAEQVRYTLTIR